MATLDNINLFAVGGATDDTQDPLYPEYLALVEQFEALKDAPTIPGGYPDAPSFSQFKRQKEAEVARDIMVENLESGDIKKAYEEGFTQLPIAEQLGVYINPITGVPVETYETGYFADEAGFQMKKPGEALLDLVNPLSSPLERLPFTAEDPMSAALAPLSALGALGGLGELANIPKAGLMALRRFQQKSMDGGGGGGIGGLPPDAFEADVKQFAFDPLSNLKSPTIESLIRNAPKNLKGNQILDWLNSKGAPSKGVKPKELPFLRIDQFIKDNPNATLPEVIEHASKNQINISKNTYRDIGEPGSDFYFDVETAMTDPLSGELSYQNLIDDITYDVENMEGVYLDDLVRDYSTRLTYDELSDYGRYGKEFTFDDMVNRINKSLESGASNETLEDVIEEYALKVYEDNPYILIEPKGSGIVGEFGNTFAYGNDDVGYTTFINGERIRMSDYGYDDVPYSQNEAEIRLQRIMEEREDIDIGMYSGQQQYKRYVDDTLPGGKNYREDVYIYENAALEDSTSGLSHFDDENQLAHMLGRDRVLEDGTETFHADEIQSDYHKKGMKYGYKDPIKDAESLKKANERSVESFGLHQKVVKQMRDELEEMKALAEKYPELKEYQGEYSMSDKDFAIRQLGGEDRGTIEFDNPDMLNTFMDHLRTKYGDSPTIEKFGVPSRIQVLEKLVKRREEELAKYSDDGLGNIQSNGVMSRPIATIRVNDGSPEQVTSALDAFKSMVNRPDYDEKMSKIKQLQGENLISLNDLKETLSRDLARFNAQYPDANLEKVMRYGDMIREGRSDSAGIFELAYEALRDAELDVLTARANAQPLDVNNMDLARLLDAELDFRVIPENVRTEISKMQDNAKQLRNLREETSLDIDAFFDYEGKASDDLKNLQKLEDFNGKEIKKVLDKVPDYPFKGDDYAEMVIKNMIVEAINDGKPAISVSGSAAIVPRYSQEEAEFFPRFYDKTIPNMMQKLAKKYGGKFERGQLDLDDTFGEYKMNKLREADTATLQNISTDMGMRGAELSREAILDEYTKATQANIIRITPEMREKILREGLPQMYMGGKVSKSNSMDKPIAGNVREM